jgi:TonB family protein
VVVSISVNDGAVTAVRIVSSSGFPSLDQYAVSHVQRRWKWSAGTTRTFTQPFRFVLK